MKDDETRCFEMFQRVNGFAADESARFASLSYVTSLFDELQGIVTDLQAHAGMQAAGLASAHQSTQNKAAGRAELLRDLSAISRTARSIPGAEEKFRFSYNLKDQDLLIVARTFQAEALPLKAEFLKRGIRVDFLEDLAADTAAFEQALSNRSEQKRSHVGATASIDDLIEGGMTRVRELDAVMRNLFADDPGKLAAWLSASHVERAPRRAKSTPTPAPTS
jgi:hypothetical protein